MTVYGPTISGKSRPAERGEGALGEGMPIYFSQGAFYDPVRNSSTNFASGLESLPRGFYRGKSALPGALLPSARVCCRGGCVSGPARWIIACGD